MIIVLQGQGRGGPQGGAAGGAPGLSSEDPRRILIVEDNPLSMKLFNDLLEAQGHETLIARTGLRGLELALSGRPDLILMDVQLPDISGLEVIRRLKSDPGTREIPVIAMTASAIPGVARQAAASGCDGFLEKPINVDEFLRTIEQHLVAPRR